MRKNNAFTLAELLITLVIVGVIASITLPTLITKINEKVTENQTATFNAKIIKGLNLTKTAGDLNSTYSSTKDFLENGLSKHLKISKICGPDELRKCIPYDNIKYELNDGKEEIAKVSKLTNPSKLKLTGGFKDISAFVLADGTPVIVSYNLNCIDDPDKADTSINGCFAGVYDINGSRRPNKFGTEIKNGKTVYKGDIRSFNGASVAPCIGKVNGLCIASSYLSGDQLLPAMQAIDPNYVQTGRLRNVAMDYCPKIGAHIPRKNELIKIASAFFGNEFDENSTFGYISPVKLNFPNTYASLGVTGNPSKIYLWSPDTYGQYAIAWRYHRPEYVSPERVYIFNDITIGTICIGE